MSQMANSSKGRRRILIDLEPRRAQEQVVPPIESVDLVMQMDSTPSASGFDRLQEFYQQDCIITKTVADLDADLNEFECSLDEGN
jgi:hypothetical protein